MNRRYVRAAKLIAVLVVWPYLCVGSVLAYSVWDMHTGRPAEFRVRATTLVVTQWPRFIHRSDVSKAPTTPIKDEAHE